MSYGIWKVNFRYGQCHTVYEFPIADISSISRNRSGGGNNIPSKFPHVYSDSTTSTVHKAQRSSSDPNEDWLVVPCPPLPNTQARMIHFHIFFYILQMPWSGNDLTLYSYLSSPQWNRPQRMLRALLLVVPSCSCLALSSFRGSRSVALVCPQRSLLTPGHCVQSPLPRSTAVWDSPTALTAGRWAQCLSWPHHPTHPDSCTVRWFSHVTAIYWIPGPVLDAE